MLPAQRINKVIQYMQTHGGGTVKELSGYLNVSEMTVRRDIKLLEEKGVVLKTHGGAILASSAASEPAYSVKAEERRDIKSRIAALAVETFVGPGDVIILEGGTTVTAMAPHLAGIPDLTILTNGLNTASQLRGLSSRAAVMCCGGLLREISGTFVGPVAESFFRQIHADTVFLSASGYREETGFTDPNMMESEVKKAMVQAAAKTVMLLDSGKLNKRSFMTTVTADELDALVTDEGASDEAVRAFEEKGIAVLRA